MHDIRLIRDDPAAFDAALSRRGLEPVAAGIVALDEKRRALTTQLQEAQSRRNEASKAIGQAMGQGDTDKAEALKAEVSELKQSMPVLEDEERALGEELKTILLALPNLLDKCELLMKVSDEYRIQTEESAAWTDEFLSQRSQLANAALPPARCIAHDLPLMSIKVNLPRTVRSVHVVLDDQPEETRLVNLDITGDVSVEKPSRTDNSRTEFKILDSFYRFLVLGIYAFFGAFSFLEKFVKDLSIANDGCYILMLFDPILVTL